MDEASVDAIVTDPPYGLASGPTAFLEDVTSGRGFMGKEWDRGVPGPAFWREALRVAKPGAYLLAFGGTRAFHRMAVAIEDAGWEIRDCVAWLYGSGFPKSLDASKAIDRMDAAAEQEQRRLNFTAWVRSTGVTSRQIDEATQTNMGGHYTTAASQPAIMTREHLEACRHLFGQVPAWVEREADIRSVESANFASRVVLKEDKRFRASDAWEANGRGMLGKGEQNFSITAPATDAAKEWAGWGTALKPAWEPVLLCRKPLEGTVAANLLRHGTGALNIDGARVGAGEGQGRWPANLMHDGSPEVVDPLGEASRFFYCAKASRADREEGCEGLPARSGADATDREEGTAGLNSPRAGASRTAEAVRNHHPTVKPTELMRYLIRLITPPGGTVLDPFMGSGSTGKAAMLEGARFVGCDLDPAYLAIAEARILFGLQLEAEEAAEAYESTRQLSLFGDL